MKLSEILKKRNSIYDEVDANEYGGAEESEEKAPSVTKSIAPSAKDGGAFEGAAGRGVGVLRMQLKRPKSFEEVTGVADCLKCGQAVVLNLEDMEVAEAKRMMDYLAGVLYAVDGKLKRSSSKTFLLTPDGVSVASEDMARLHPEI